MPARASFLACPCSSVLLGVDNVDTVELYRGVEGSVQMCIASAIQVQFTSYTNTMNQLYKYSTSKWWVGRSDLLEKRASRGDQLDFRRRHLNLSEIIVFTITIIILLISNFSPSIYSDTAERQKSANSVLPRLPFEVFSSDSLPQGGCTLSFPIFRFATEGEISGTF